MLFEHESDVVELLHVVQELPVVERAPRILTAVKDVFVHGLELHVGIERCIGDVIHERKKCIHSNAIQSVNVLYHVAGGFMAFLLSVLTFLDDFNALVNIVDYRHGHHPARLLSMPILDILCRTECEHDRDGGGKGGHHQFFSHTAYRLVPSELGHLEFHVHRDICY